MSVCRFGVARNGTASLLWNAGLELAIVLINSLPQTLPEFLLINILCGNLADMVMTYVINVSAVNWYENCLRKRKNSEKDGYDFDRKRRTTSEGTMVFWIEL